MFKVLVFLYNFYLFFIELQGFSFKKLMQLFLVVAENVKYSSSSSQKALAIYR
jgi:hypothetical protein